MLVQELLAGLVIFISPILPSILVPIAFSMVAVLMYQKANPREVASIMIAATMIECIVIWFIEGYILKKMKEYKIKHNKSDIVTLRFNKTISFFMKGERKNRMIDRVERNIKTKHGKIITFLLAVFCCAPTVPDIITIRIFRYRMKLGYFLIAAFIGKVISFVPFIFLGKGIFSLLGL